MSTFIDSYIQGQEHSVKMRGLRNALSRDDIDTRNYGEKQGLGLGLLRNEKTRSDTDLSYLPEDRAHELKKRDLDLRGDRMGNDLKMLTLGIDNMSRVRDVKGQMSFVKYMQDNYGLPDEMAQQLLPPEGEDFNTWRDGVLLRAQRAKQQLEQEMETFKTDEDIRRNKANEGERRETYKQTGYGLPQDVKLMNAYESETDPERKAWLLQLLQKEAAPSGSSRTAAAGGMSEAELSKLENDLRQEYTNTMLDENGKPVAKAPSVDVYVRDKMRERMNASGKIRQSLGLPAGEASAPRSNVGLPKTYDGSYGASFAPGSNGLPGKPQAEGTRNTPSEESLLDEWNNIMTAKERNNYKGGFDEYRGFRMEAETGNKIPSTPTGLPQSKAPASAHPSSSFEGWQYAARDNRISELVEKLSESETITDQEIEDFLVFLAQSEEGKKTAARLKQEMAKRQSKKNQPSTMLYGPIFYPRG